MRVTSLWHTKTRRRLVPPRCVRKRTDSVLTAHYSQLCKQDKFGADLAIDSDVQVKLGPQECDLDSTRSTVSNSLQT